MDGKRFLNWVKFTNLLSFGPEGMKLELQPLNVLIGANGSGKSNFIDAMRIIQAIPVDLSIPFSRGDTASEWVNKNINNDNKKFNIEFEKIGDYTHIENNDIDNLYFYYFAEIDVSKPRVKFNTEKYLYNYGLINLYNGESLGKIYNHDDDGLRSMMKKLLTEEDKIFNHTYYNSMKNILSVQEIRIYSDYDLGRYSKIRMPQNASLDPGDIFEGFENLSLVLNDLISKPEILNLIIEKMKIFYENIINVNTRTAFGTIQLYIQELGLSETIPATRLSDGTIRFLSLLAILLHPEPPPLICIEEPEVGMHPDILSTIAELLIDASKQTQIIITTHSDILLSAIGKTCPEAVVVCEKGQNGTRMTRPDPEQLSKWIEENSDLGSVWMSGLMGGTRW